MDYPLDNPLDPSQRSWMSWCPGALGFWVALQKFRDYDYSGWTLKSCFCARTPFAAYYWPRDSEDGYVEISLRASVEAFWIIKAVDDKLRRNEWRQRSAWRIGQSIFMKDWLRSLWPGWQLFWQFWHWWGVPSAPQSHLGGKEWNGGKTQRVKRVGHKGFPVYDSGSFSVNSL